MSQETSADEVKAYFSQFGKVEEAVMLMDQQTKRHRGFGFVTFEVGFCRIFASNDLFKVVIDYSTLSKSNVLSKIHYICGSNSFIIKLTICLDIIQNQKKYSL